MHHIRFALEAALEPRCDYTVKLCSLACITQSHTSKQEFNLYFDLLQFFKLFPPISVFQIIENFYLGEFHILQKSLQSMLFRLFLKKAPSVVKNLGTKVKSWKMRIILTVHFCICNSTWCPFQKSVLYELNFSQTSKVMKIQVYNSSLGFHISL